MRIQLWSYNYDPEPMGIGPVSTIWAETMKARGHQVEVVAAHPHYPRPEWGKRLLPYRESRGGVSVTRLPLFIGRSSQRRRMMQELSFLASQTISSPFLGRPDLLVSVSPSFPALLPAMLYVRSRRVPWVIWLQDILPDGAAATGYLDDSSRVYRWSRALEDAAYRTASKVVVLSDSFHQNLLSKGVPDSKLKLIYNPATLPVRFRYREKARPGEPPRIICMGNIGRSQGLVEIVEDFESSENLRQLGAKLVITGSGVAEREVKAAIRTDRVEMTGLLSQEDLEMQLQMATLAAVTQGYSSGEFNVPSKLMNYLAVGIPVIASVRIGSEAARIVNRAQAGWIAPPGQFSSTVEQALSKTDQLNEKALSGNCFAADNLTSSSLADRFESILE